MTADEFKVALQELTNFPLRSYVLPFLKTHVPYLQRDIASQARACNQVGVEYCCFLYDNIDRCWRPTKKDSQITSTLAQ